MKLSARGFHWIVGAPNSTWIYFGFPQVASYRQPPSFSLAQSLQKV